MKPYRILALVVLALFLSVPCVPPLHAGMPSDLKLKETIAQKVIISPRPNPHELIQCLDCHQKKPTGNPFMAVKPQEFLKDDYPDELCQRCHQGKCELHPFDVDTQKSSLKITTPGILPLRFIHEGKYKLVCMTCHDIHYPHNGFKLLRGYTINPRVQPSRFSSRLDFCRSCHGEEMNNITPHKRSPGQKGCTFCHVTKPAGDKAEPLRAGINALCSYCHPVSPEPHYLRFNPFPDIEPGKMPQGLPLVNGQYTCITCHQVHGDTKMPAYVRPQLIELARSSFRINPHETKVFCIACHLEQPPPLTSKVKSVQLVDNDITTLCNKCHATGHISGMDHPLVKLTQGFNQPGDLPLTSEGRITCTTCHQAHHEVPLEDNPFYLRGGPYKSFQQLCFKCHPQGALAGRNPHQEFQMDKGCEICHLDGEIHTLGNLKVGPIRADGVFVCLICHEYYPHPASYTHTVRPGQYEYVSFSSKDIPLDRFGRITCFSCHQTHQKPIVNNFMRLVSQSPMVCSNCHPY